MKFAFWLEESGTAFELKKPLLLFLILKQKPLLYWKLSKFMMHTFPHQLFAAFKTLLLKMTKMDAVFIKAYAPLCFS